LTPGFAIMPRLFDILIGAGGFALALSLVGCGADPYPAELEYPLRSDPIVIQLPSTPPDGPPAAGRLDQFIAAIDERGGKTGDPAKISSAQRAALRQALADRFGTPAAPRIQGDDECRALAESLQLQPEKLAAGSVLYRRLCLQCHGLTGDGRSSVGQWVFPPPRDFRQGVFKYVSSAGSAARKPARADLHRVMNAGIDGASMPPFNLLSDDDRERVVAYSIFLSLRGEVEFRLLLGLLGPGGDLDDNLAVEADVLLKTAMRQWLEADRDRIIPQALPTPEGPDERASPAHLESVRRGAKLFASQAIGCAGCHVDYGRQSRYLYDCWGSAIRPADLTEGAFRGGKQPVELFQRIRGGIGASGMPAATSLAEAEVWDLVHFLLALSTPSMLPPDVRGEIYPLR
jgi:mono/diheme cytochrome c family protein